MVLVEYLEGLPQLLVYLPVLVLQCEGDELAELETAVVVEVQLEEGLLCDGPTYLAAVYLGVAQV